MSVMQAASLLLVIACLVFAVVEAKAVRRSEKAARPPADPTRHMPPIQAQLRAQEQYRVLQDEKAADLESWRQKRRDAA